MADHASFMRDVRQHRMTVELDQGVHRSIYFGRPGSGFCHFRLNTWPGYLSISGDVGDYTFTRHRDMFEFFRFDMAERGERLDQINPGYWSEKAQAVDKLSGLTQFNHAAYVEAVRDCMNSHISYMILSDAKRAVRDAQEEYLFEPPESVDEAHYRAMSWRCPVTHEAPFSDFYEHRLTAPSWRVLWCFRAIRWGIWQYDLAQQGRTQAAHDRRVLAGEI